MLVYGVQDANLRRIADEFTGVKIAARGNEVTLRGEEREVILVEKVFAELLFLVNRNGELQSRDLDAVINLIVAGKPQPQSVADFDDVILITKSDAVKAKTDGQRRLVAEARRNDVVFVIGPAGTGKTYTAVAIAVAALKQREIARIVLARPAVEAGESLGFLPGDLTQKIDPYLRPLYDALQDMITAEKLKEYLEKKVIEIVPLAYMRGRTLNNSFIILDEAQNATSTQMKMCLTRLGMNSRAIVTGDVSQIDLPAKVASGLVEVPALLEGIEGISFVYLDKRDVVRHRLVREIIEAYDKAQAMKERLKPVRHDADPRETERAMWEKRDLERRELEKSELDKRASVAIAAADIEKK
ncbi:MAG: PhoH family protein [Rhizobacter sp.]|nr:PhoH family protein [Chlorobiales bacterium]